MAGLLSTALGRLGLGLLAKTWSLAGSLHLDRVGRWLVQ